MTNYDPLSKNQKRYIHNMLSMRQYGLPLDCGKGKTRIMLEAIYRLFKSGEITSVLIVTKLSIAGSVWQDEAKKWGFPFVFQLLHKQESVEIKPAHIYLLNDEMVSIMRGRDPRKKDGRIIEAVPARPRDIPIATMLIVDESSRFKNASSNKFRGLRRLLPLFTRRHIMAATPTPKSSHNMWSQMYIMDMGERLFGTLGEFRDNFFHRGGFKNREFVPNEDAFTLITERIKDIFFHYDEPAEDNMLYRTIPVNMPAEDKKAYQILTADGIATVRGRPIETFHIGTLRAILRQYSGGAFNYEDEVIVCHDAKMKALDTLLTELDGKNLLVAYNFTHEMERICQYFKALNPVVIRGGLKLKELNGICERWNRKEIRLLLAQSQTISHGFNMQFGGHHICWFSPTEDLEMYYQFNKRLDRRGQTEKVTIHHIASRGTLDAKCYRALETKGDMQAVFKEELKVKFSGTR